MLIAIHRCVYQTGALCLIFEDWPDADIPLLADHRHVLALPDRLSSVQRRCFRHAGGFHHHVQRQIHHQHGIREDDLFTTLQCRQRGLATVTDHHIIVADPRMATGATRRFDIPITYHRHFKLGDNLSLRNHRCRVVARTDHTGPDNSAGTQSLNKLSIDHEASFPGFKDLQFARFQYQALFIRKTLLKQVGETFRAVGVIGVHIVVARYSYARVSQPDRVQRTQNIHVARLSVDAEKSHINSEARADIAHTVEQHRIAGKIKRHAVTFDHITDSATTMYRLHHMHPVVPDFDFGPLFNLLHAGFRKIERVNQLATDFR